MKKVVVVLCVLMNSISGLFAQEGSVEQFLGADVGVGDSEGVLALTYHRDFKLGKKQRIVAGFGARFTSYFGRNRYYITAPAKLTSGSTGPGVIFKENIEANIDTFMVKSPQMNSLNLMITVGYNVSERLMLRFNIDAIGLTFGKEVGGYYINGQQVVQENASPTLFNLLLISDNDKGSLNSELFGRYMINEKWAVNGGLQFHFTEYTTDTRLQQFPEENDRFRYKSLMASIGGSFRF